MDKQREMFEAWWQESRPSCWVTDWYANMLQDIAWRAWQAALAAQPAVPNGYKIVPVEPTPYMLAIGQIEWLDSAGADPSGDIYRAMIKSAK